MLDELLECLLIGAIALISTMLLVPAASLVARKFDAIDYPSGRRVNTVPIPRMGGIAAVGGISISLALMYILVKSGAWLTPFGEHPVLQIDWTVAAIGVLCMFATGIADDIFDLSPAVKLAGQVVAACIVASSGVLLVSIGDPFSSSTIPLGWLAYPITVIYLVAFANIINLIDGLDGLCCGITIVATASVMFFAFTAARMDTLLLGSAIIGACLGFLKFNHHPAKIFLGDSGSLTLGLLLGILSLVAIARSSLFTSLLVPLLAAGVPFIDTISAIIRRKRGHQSIGQADRGHIHHRLIDAGYSQTKTVAIMVSWTAFLSVGGIAITFIHSWIRYVIFAGMVIVSGIIIWKLGVLKPVLAHAYSPRLSKRHIKDGTFTEEDEEKAKTGGFRPVGKIEDKENWR